MIKSIIFALLIIASHTLPSCPAKSVLNTTSLQCVPCASNCYLCEETIGLDQNGTRVIKIQCVDCVGGFVLMNQTCVNCGDYRCIACIGPGVCDECYGGYYYSSSALSCLPCNSQCKQCSSSDNCTQCPVGFILQNGKCNGSCMPNCAGCQSQSVCLQCFPGYYYDSGNSMCLSCPIECPSCLNATYCVSCVVGRGLMGSVCLPCPHQCIDCYNSNNILMCRECNPNYYITANGSCFKCQTLCLVCTENGCISAPVGYSINSVGGVVACPANCAYCSNNQCVRCYLGNALNGSTGYYLAGNGTCVACQLGCNVCNTALVCSNCVDGYYLQQNSCLRCPTGCATCLSPLQCNYCITGYLFYMQNNTCVPCQANCAVCNQTNSCLMCKQGYDVDNFDPDNVCVMKCSQIVSNCNECNYLPANYSYLQTKFKCYGCNTGYQLNNNNCVKIKVTAKHNSLAIVFIVLFVLFLIMSIVLGVLLFREKHQKVKEQKRVNRGESTVQMIIT